MALSSQALVWATEHWAPLAAFGAATFAAIRMYIQVGMFSEYLKSREAKDDEAAKREEQIASSLRIFEETFEAHMRRHDELYKLLARRLSAVERELRNRDKE